SRAHISNTVRLLGLAASLQGALLSGALSAGHARALAGLEHSQQEAALRRVLRDELNVRQAEELARDWIAAPDPGTTRPARRARAGDVELRAIEDEFRRALGTKVKLARTGQRGRLVIEFYSD